MRRSESFSLQGFVVKTCIMLLVLSVFPLYATSSSGTWQVASMAFVIYEQIVYIMMTQIGSSSASFTFSPLEVIAVGLAECMPGIYFFYRVSVQDISKRIRRSLVLASGTIFIMSFMLPGVLPVYTIDGVFYWYYYYLVMTTFPVLILAAFVFIPAFLHESSLMALDSASDPGVRGNSRVGTRVASRRAARTVGLLIMLASLVLPYSLFIVSYQGYAASGCIAPLFLASFAVFQGGGTVISSLQYTVYPVTFVLITLVPSLLRLVFAKKLLSYCRGIGSSQKLVVTGLIAEAWAYVASGPLLGLVGGGFGGIPVPLPALLVLGILIIKKRDSFTQPVKVSDQEIWPLAFEEEGPKTREPSLQPQYVMIKVPVAYMLISRVRIRRKGNGGFG